jgi:hypothetical protein
VHEQDRASSFRWIAGAFLKQKKLHTAIFASPMVLDLDRARGGLGHLIHRSPLIDAV